MWIYSMDNYSVHFIFLCSSTIESFFTMRFKDTLIFFRNNFLKILMSCHYVYWYVRVTVKEKVRVTERERSCAHWFTLQCWQQPGLGQTDTNHTNSILVSHVGGRNSSPGITIHCSVPINRESWIARAKEWGPIKWQMNPLYPPLKELSWK